MRLVTIPPVTLADPVQSISAILAATRVVAWGSTGRYRIWRPISEAIAAPIASGLAVA
jgi:hypothetical protein